MEISLNQIIGVSEAARIIGVQDARVLTYIQSKRLPAAKIGRTWVILRHNAEAFVRGKPGRPMAK